VLSIYLNDALRGGPKTHLTLTREGTLVSNLRILLAIIFGLAGIVALWLFGAVGLSSFLLQ
jgi:hypothetical protein